MLIVTNLALDEIAGDARRLAAYDAMTLEEAMRLSNSLDVNCVRPSCAAVTRVNLQFFASRRRLDTRLDALAKTLVCTACGGAHVVIGVSTD